MTQSLPNQTAKHAAKSFARLAAVQAVYQISYEQQPVAKVIQECIDGGFQCLREETDKPSAEQIAPDVELFGVVVRGVAENQVEIDEMLSGALSERFSVERIELLLKAILRAGTFELYKNSSVPSGIIINDYIDVTRTFFNGKEPGLVNAVLDKLAQKLRDE
ncbi:MAG: transcription antitermination factor NusB [Alphaproteobacteria bacterium]|nr:transcription antitermination factor NusB [Alphaproteobacteria bacterium]